MKHARIIIFFAAIFAGCQTMPHREDTSIKTFCNPININYRFQLEEPSRREAADPAIVWYKDRYFLFASKSGGYWHSTNLLDWTLVETQEIPVEDYAPSAIVIKDTLYFLASSHERNNIYKSVDPLNGKWSIARAEIDTPVWDPAFFLDDDERLYLYWGCSDQNPLYGVELDYDNNFSFIGKPVALKFPNPQEYGWEVPGDYNTLVNNSPWIEGPWINKHKGKYYLQYAGPGTEFKSYSDGVYVSDNPLGPFTVQQHNPFAYKPEGFAAGAGHGGTFEDKFGNLWHIGTISISQKHMFERRLGLFPTFFDEDGTLYSITKFGDYPLIMPQKKILSFEDIFPGWMMLSYAKKVEVSSSIDTLPPQYMVDEDIRTYWAAESGDSGEFAILDLGDLMDVYAVQVNFAEHNTAIYGRESGLKHRFIVASSGDAEKWETIIDRSQSQDDDVHEYIPLAAKTTCRYLKLTNLEVPGGNFAVSGFRVFGKGNGTLPEKAGTLLVKRSSEDKRKVHLYWNKVESAIGYNICYGIDSTKMYQNYMVYSDTSLTINTLNSSLEYYFTIEPFNEKGITKSGIVTSGSQ